MTRETALRRMLAGVKMCHPDDKLKGYWRYDARAMMPIIFVWVTIAGTEEIRNLNLYNDFMAKRKGWKEYKG